MKQHQPGDTVAIVNRSLSGRFVVEGRARVIREIDGGTGRYEVVFVDAPASDGSVFRYVDPAAQRNPESYVAHLNESRGDE